MMDFHCHLDLFPRPREVAAEAARRGAHLLSVTTTPKAWAGTLALANENVLTAVGLHPELAKDRKAEAKLVAALIPQTNFVGEIGLDGSPPHLEHMEDQLLVFRRILQACQLAGGRILSIHSRGAARSVLDCLEEFPMCGTPVLHWFSGSSKELSRAAALGCWFSVGRPMVQSERGRALISQMPRQRIVLETDGPFVQGDAGPMMPWDLEKVCGKLGGLFGASARSAKAAVERNSAVLLRGLGGPQRPHVEWSK